MAVVLVVVVVVAVVVVIVVVVVIRCAFLCLVDALSRRYANHVSMIRAGPSLCHVDALSRRFAFRCAFLCLVDSLSRLCANHISMIRAGPFCVMSTLSFRVSGSPGYGATSPRACADSDRT